MGIYREDEGQVLVLTAFSIVLILGFVGMAADMGQLFHVKRQLQLAADAAATAGALYQSNGLSAVNAGIAAAKDNGFSKGVDGVDVTINTPPSYGPAATEQGFVEAIISAPNPTIFMSLFGFTSVTVTARAVAGSVPGMPCAFMTNTTGPDLTLQGAAKIVKPDGGKTCGIYSFSDSPNSIEVTGNGNTVDAAYVETAGGISGSGTLYDSSNNPTQVGTDVPPPTLPSKLVLSLPDPSTMSCATPTGNPVKAKNGYQKNEDYITLTAADLAGAKASTSGVFAGAKCISGNVFLDGSGDPSGTLTLDPGLYVFTGDVAIGNNVQADGVTLDISSGNLGVSSTTNVQINACASNSACIGTQYGAIPDMALVAPGWPETPQPPNWNTSQWTISWGAAGGNGCTLETSSTGMAFNGIIDAPGITLNLQDQGGTALVTGFVVGSLQLGTGTLCLDNYSGSHPNSPLNTITLVE